VNALKAIKGSLVDPSNKLKNWGSGDPCTSNWTGILCNKIPSDSYLHVTEMYDDLFHIIYYIHNCFLARLLFLHPIICLLFISAIFHTSVTFNSNSVCLWSL